MDDDQQFCLRWNNHQSTLVSVFDTLLEKGIHVDCTLAAEGQTLRAHKVVLCACSPYFESVLSQHYDKHPIIILKDVKYAELRAMMDYMYRGEVNISQDQLAALLKAAESLQIKGLSDNKPSRPVAAPAPPAPAPAPAPPLPALAPALPALPVPPRAASPPPQVREGSIDSRSASSSPTRRRKRARRLSAEGPPLGPHHTGNGEDSTPCKEETTRDGVEDLTIDEDADEQPHVTHNDVVRNFQWHMERSQDEIMNSSDGVRDSQGRTETGGGIVTRSRRGAPEPAEPESPEGRVTTLAILKPRPAPPAAPPAPPAPAPAADKKAPPAAPLAPKVDRATTPEPPRELKRERYDLFARDRSLPCAQYKTEKGYKCPNCQRCYNARKNLVRHVTLECGRDPQYKCPLCSYSKHRRNELKKHMERKHPEFKSPSEERDRDTDRDSTPASSPAPLAVK